jgi:hypothetical protein
VGVAPPPVAYGNRAELATAASSLPGLRFVDVSFSGGSVEGDAYLLPYQLRVAIFVDGDGDGEAPTYTGDLSAPPVPPPAELAAMAHVGDVDQPEPEAVPTQESEPAEPGTAPTAADADGQGLSWSTLALGLLGGGLLTVGAFMAMRRRSSR